MTTRNDIAGWFLEGVKSGYSYMAVMCDMFDYIDYPKYFNTRQDMMVVEMNPGTMQKVMETYSLNGDMSEQLCATRNFVK